VADHLKEQIRIGRWTDVIPGENLLVTQLQIGRDTARAALALLEEEGLVVSDGPGRRRRIVEGRSVSRIRKLRLRILPFDKQTKEVVVVSTLLAELQEAGCDVDFASKSLHELGMDVGRVARLVTKEPADAWITCACARPINEWFSAQPFPTLALFGRIRGLPMAAAAPALIPSLVAAVRHLTGHGHKRIVMFAREERRKPVLALPERTFMEELNAAGLETSAYNLPDWEENRDGLIRQIDELFRLTPPTALIFQETPIFVAARAYLAQRGIIAPRDISLLACDPDPSFEWSKPTVSHLRWDHRPVVRRVVKWAKNIARGKDDIRQVLTDSEFFEGETIGPAPRKR
jgi:DNA-binding LacI/PurR family transcriptional regulator